MYIMPNADTGSMRPFGSQETLEHRRHRAMDLLEAGLTMNAVARRLNTTVTSVFRWKSAHKQGGNKALAAKPVSGRPRKLDDKERKRLLEILLQGALVYGFPNDLWTLKRIARVIWKEFEVEYHPGHVWKLLRSLGWSCQVPERRPIQRDEHAIEDWMKNKWPHIKKSRKTWCPSCISRRKRIPSHTNAP